jgi:hypothetical protein
LEGDWGWAVACWADGDSCDGERKADPSLMTARKAKVGNKSESKGRSRFPEGEGMTERKARAKANMRYA